MIKWFLTGVAALNVMTTIGIIGTYPDLYSWTHTLVDVALVVVASLAWAVEKETA